MLFHGVSVGGSTPCSGRGAGVGAVVGWPRWRQIRDPGTWESKAASCPHGPSQRLFSFRQKILPESRDLPRCFLECVTWKYRERTESGLQSCLRRQTGGGQGCPIARESPGLCCPLACPPPAWVPAGNFSRAPRCALLCRLPRSSSREEREIIAQVSTRLQPQGDGCWHPHRLPAPAGGGPGGCHGAGASRQK